MRASNMKYLNLSKNCEQFKQLGNLTDFWATLYKKGEPQ
jgi:hypothetical protein